MTRPHDWSSDDPRAWSPAELEVLHDLNLTSHEVAARTGRSYQAVKSQRRDRKISGARRTHGPNPLAPEVEAILLDPSITHVEAARRTGLPLRSARARRQFKGVQPATTTVVRFTDDELAVALDPKLTAAEAGRRIDRSRAAVRQQRTRFGVKVPNDKDPNRIGSRRLLAKTCLACGLLLDATCFNRYKHAGRPGAYHEPRCRACVGLAVERVEGGRARRNAASRAYEKAAQALTLQTADRNGYEWTTSDLETLEDPSRTVLQKALALKRTYAAVSSKAADVGYRSARPSVEQIIAAGKTWRIDFPDSNMLECA